MWWKQKSSHNASFWKCFRIQNLFIGKDCVSARPILENFLTRVFSTKNKARTNRRLSTQRYIACRRTPEFLTGKLCIAEFVSVCVCYRTANGKQTERLGKGRFVCALTKNSYQLSEEDFHLYMVIEQILSAGFWLEKIIDGFLSGIYLQFPIWYKNGFPVEKRVHFYHTISRYFRKKINVSFNCSSNMKV